MAVASLSLPPSALLPSFLPSFLRRHHYALTNCKTPGLLKEGGERHNDGRGRGRGRGPRSCRVPPVLAPTPELRRKRDFLHLGGRGHTEHTPFALILLGILPSRFPVPPSL